MGCLKFWRCFLLKQCLIKLHRMTFGIMVAELERIVATKSILFSKLQACISWIGPKYNCICWRHSVGISLTSSTVAWSMFLLFIKMIAPYIIAECASIWSNVPLDWITSVWKFLHGMWQLHLSGFAEKSHWKSHDIRCSPKHHVLFVFCHKYKYCPLIWVVWNFEGASYWSSV